MFSSRSNIFKDFMYLFLFYRIFIYMSIWAVPRCIIYEPKCIKTQKGRRITPTLQLLSGFIFSYLHWFFCSLHFYIHTTSSLKCISIMLIFMCFSYHWSIHNLCIDFLSTLFLVLSLYFLLALHYTPISTSLRLIFSLFFLNFLLLISSLSWMEGFFAFTATFLSSIRLIKASFF